MLWLEPKTHISKWGKVALLKQSLPRHLLKLNLLELELPRIRACNINNFPPVFLPGKYKINDLSCSSEDFRICRYFPVCVCTERRLQQTERRTHFRIKFLFQRRETVSQTSYFCCCSRLYTFFSLIWKESSIFSPTQTVYITQIHTETHTHTHCNVQK